MSKKKPDPVMVPLAEVLKLIDQVASYEVRLDRAAEKREAKLGNYSLAAGFAEAADTCEWLGEHLTEELIERYAGK